MPSSSSSRRVDEPVPVVTQQRSRSASLQPARLSALLHGGSNPSTSTNHISSSSSGICATSGSLRNPPPEKRAAESSHFVIVAVDFGTTYSGYAFCFTHKPSDIHVMRKWPGDPDLSNQKTRTALLLKPNGDFDSFGFVARDRYHDLKPNEASRYFFFEKFKMILHHDMSLSRDTEIMAVNGKTLPAAVVFRHALQFFRDHALAEIGEGCGLDAGLNEEDVRWVLTVPAIWRQPAKQLMREAAYKAGMASADQPQRLLIALEPEAAAIYCRKLKFWDLKDRSPAMSTHTWHGNTCFTEYVIKELEKGTTYMVVDCGGGTVDITVHEIMDAEGNMKEIQKASGDACGSIEKKVRQGDVDWCADCFDKFVVEDDSVQLGDVVLRRYTPARPDQTTLVMHIYSSKRSDAEFTTDTGVRKCGSLQLELAQSRLDVAYSKNPIREVQVRMVLGDTEIRASALDLATGLHVKTNIDFLAY
ncbi:unnamed protein product [Notodromas monacha]|uniref:Heat shock 70 kDa protein 12A n=1 Tax=Notodromas monacha TaxID=399045 RepID=A0A7R9BFB3_9CRUS|nr:unnamed protein product [Notodromas monacha]CAG0912775.1 unnamed protein product [Notodromas monacha]